MNRNEIGVASMTTLRSGLFFVENATLCILKCEADALNELCIWMLI